MGLQRRALVDTGACANVILKQTFDDLKDEKSLYRPLKIIESKLTRVRMAGGRLVPIETEVTIEFRLADMTFVESFLVLHAANSIILGNPFYKKHHFHICAKYNLLHFPDLTLQINEIKPPNEPRRINRVKKFPLTYKTSNNSSASNNSCRMSFKGRMPGHGKNNRNRNPIERI